MIEQILKERLTDKRFNHSLGVRDTAAELAAIYGVDVEKARLAGLIHDCCKGMSAEDSEALCLKYGIDLTEFSEMHGGLLHAPLGAEFAKRELRISDREILDAIYYHTTGRPDMTMLEKIIYIADYIEPNRKGYYWLPSMRALAPIDIDSAVLLGLNLSIIYILDKNEMIHSLTTNARNHYLRRTKC